MSKCCASRSLGKRCCRGNSSSSSRISFQEARYPEERTPGNPTRGDKALGPLLKLNDMRSVLLSTVEGIHHDAVTLYIFQ